jgi:hypothetical protein
MQFRTVIVWAAPFLSGTLLLPSGAALAHHSFAMFDQTRHVKIEGVVKEYQWTQPHVWLDVMVANNQGGGTVLWGLESQSPGILHRRGWRPDSFKPGDKVVVDVFPMKDGTAGGQMLRAVLPDGRVFTTAMNEDIRY